LPVAGKPARGVRRQPPDLGRRLGVAERLARCLADPRSPGRVHHTPAEMIRFRVLLIAAGYPDANDRAALHSDLAFKVRLAERGENPL
jgi:hypothetical protein